MTEAERERLLRELMLEKLSLARGDDDRLRLLAILDALSFIIQRLPEGKQP